MIKKLLLLILLGIGAYAGYYFLNRSGKMNKGLLFHFTDSDMEKNFEETGIGEINTSCPSCLTKNGTLGGYDILIPDPTEKDNEVLTKENFKTLLIEISKVLKYSAKKTWIKTCKKYLQNYFDKNRFFYISSDDTQILFEQLPRGDDVKKTFPDVKDQLEFYCKNCIIEISGNYFILLPDKDDELRGNPYALFMGLVTGILKPDIKIKWLNFMNEYTKSFKSV